MPIENKRITELDAANAPLDGTERLHIAQTVSGSTTSRRATVEQILDLLETRLASTANGEGASKVGVEDAAGNFTSTDVEAVLAEIISTLASTSTGEGASTIGVEDANSYFTGSTVEAVLNELGNSPIVYDNRAINGSMQVAQRADASLSTSYLFGAVDRFAARSDVSPGAGTITQNISSTIGTTGRSLQLSGVTLGSPGSVFIRYRMSARDAEIFVNNTLTVATEVLHDVGSAIDYTVTVNKADAINDFTSVTLVETGSAQSVSSSTETTVSHTVSDMGDCSNGIEIIIEADCGTITTKNFEFADFRIHPVNRVLPFVARPFVQELQLCEHYFEKSYDLDADPGSSITNGLITVTYLNNRVSGFIFKTRKIKVPSVTIYARGGTSGEITDMAGANDYPATVEFIGESGVGRLNSGTAPTGATYQLHFTSDAEL